MLLITRNTVTRIPSQWCLKISGTPGRMHSHNGVVYQCSEVSERSRAVPSRPERSRAVPRDPRDPRDPSRPEPSRAVPAALTKPSARTLDPARCPVCQMCLDISYCPSPHPSPTSPWVHNASDLPWCPRRSVREVPKCSLELKVMWAQKGW